MSFIHANHQVNLQVINSPNTPIDKNTKKDKAQALNKAKEASQVLEESPLKSNNQKSLDQFDIQPIKLSLNAQDQPESAGIQKKIELSEEEKEDFALLAQLESNRDENQLTLVENQLSQEKVKARKEKVSTQILSVIAKKTSVFALANLKKAFAGIQDAIFKNRLNSAEAQHQIARTNQQVSREQSLAAQLKTEENIEFKKIKSEIQIHIDSLEDQVVNLEDQVVNLVDGFTALFRLLDEGFEAVDDVLKDVMQNASDLRNKDLPQEERENAIQNLLNCHDHLKNLDSSSLIFEKYDQGRNCMIRKVPKNMVNQDEAGGVPQKIWHEGLQREIDLIVIEMDDDEHAAILQGISYFVATLSLMAAMSSYNNQTRVEEDRDTEAVSMPKKETKPETFQKSKEKTSVLETAVKQLNKIMSQHLFDNLFELAEKFDKKMLDQFIKQIEKEYEIRNEDIKYFEKKSEIHKTQTRSQERNSFDLRKPELLPMTRSFVARLYELREAIASGEA